MVSAIIHNKPCCLIAETDRYVLYERESTGSSVWTNFVVEIRGATGRKYYTIGWDGERFSKTADHDILKKRAPAAEKWATFLIHEIQVQKIHGAHMLLSSSAPPVFGEGSVPQCDHAPPSPASLPDLPTHGVAQPTSPRKDTEMLVAARRLASLVQDYRSDEGVAIDPEHVLRWAEQFPVAERAFVVTETTHVLHTTYLSATRLDHGVNQLAQRFSDAISQRRWIETHVAGDSQSWMLNQLRARHLESNLSAPNLLFVDDIIFSGGRAFQDIKAWTDKHRATLARHGDVLVLSLIRHTGSATTLTASHYGLQPLLGPLGFVPILEQLALVNNGKLETDETQYVLRCIDFPQVHENLEYHKHFRARTPGCPTDSVFSSDAARTRYEKLMYTWGVQIRQQCQNLPKQMRPLGNTHLSTPGFGALFVTARNCANNCPLAWWVGTPWFPLFPRRTNKHFDAAPYLAEYDDYYELMS